MTAADLERLDELREETNRLRSRLERLRNASVVSATNYSQTGGNGGTGDPVSRTACSAADIEEEMLRNVLEMVEIIDKIPSEKTRKIFRRRYINRRTWSQIADELGYSDERNLRRRVSRYKNRVKNGEYSPVMTLPNSVK